MPRGAHLATAFEIYLKRNSKKFEEYLSTFFTDGTHPDMDRYLYDPLSQYYANAGKRHRPLICLLACDAVGGDSAAGMAVCRGHRALPHGSAHPRRHRGLLPDPPRRTLPPRRRGRGPGDQRRRPRTLARVRHGGRRPRSDDATKLRVLKELVDMTTRTIEGQALDIGWARDDRFDLTVDDYLVMANHKTAFYSGAVPLAVGAIIGGGTESQIEVAACVRARRGTRVPDTGRRSQSGRQRRSP